MAPAISGSIAPVSASITMNQWVQGISSSAKTPTRSASYAVRSPVVEPLSQAPSSLQMTGTACSTAQRLARATSL